MKEKGEDVCESGCLLFVALTISFDRLGRAYSESVLQ